MTEDDMSRLAQAVHEYLDCIEPENHYSLCWCCCNVCADIEYEAR